MGVLDKAVRVLGALERGPASLAQLVDATSLARPTAHRLAIALEHHRFVSRDGQGRFVLGARVAELAAGSGEDRLLVAAGRALAQLRDASGESAQLYRRSGSGADRRRVCVAAAERPGHGLRDSVPVGAVLTMLAGSAAQVLLAWAPAEELEAGLVGATFDAAALATVRRRGWAQSVGEREEGVVSVSAPVRGPDGSGGPDGPVVAAVSVSGPLQRLGRTPGREHAGAVVDAAQQLSAALAHPSPA